VLFDRLPKGGGLNEYGIAAYKTVDEFAQRAVKWILDIGGIQVHHEAALGEDFTLAELMDDHDAVFLGIGLGDVNRLGIENEDVDGVIDAVQYIAELRQTRDKGSLPVGNSIVVIGGGMTAIDIAVQSKRLGANRVDIVYRRGPEQMGASRYEQEFAQTNGVTIRHWAKPLRILGEKFVTGIEFERTVQDAKGKLAGSGETWSMEADVVFKAVGQRLGSGLPGSAASSLKMHDGKISVSGDRRTSLNGVWAGGDCVAGGEDLTVTAVQDGKVAAHSIDRYLRPQTEQVVVVEQGHRSTVSKHG
jgi:glutamate synthase (NADPH/NADH) small chain